MDGRPVPAGSPDAPDGPTLLCITPSPAIDRTAHVERIRRGEVLRPTELVALPGGKGVNAARAAARLGGVVMTSGIAGGHAGRWIEEALAAEGLAPNFAHAAAESRTTYVVVDGEGDPISVYEPPAAVRADEFEAFLSLLRDELLPQCARAVVAGSVPAGIGPGGLGRIVEVCRRTGTPLLVDVSGPSLLAVLEAGPDIVKVGRVEVVEVHLVGRDASSLDAALALVIAGAELAVVTDARQPVVAVDGATIWQVSVPEVRAVNTVGSGDAFGAAMSLALMAGESMETALVRGVAAGAANALALGAGVLDPERARQLESGVEVSVTRR